MTREGFARRAWFRYVVKSEAGFNKSFSVKAKAIDFARSINGWVLDLFKPRGYGFKTIASFRKD